MSTCKLYLNNDIAKNIGVNSALVLQNFAFWINLNMKKNKNFFDGKHWTFQTLNSICEKFPFLTQNKIRYAIDKLIQSGYIIKGNYNKTKYDRTVWYAFKDESTLQKVIKQFLENSQMDVGEFTNPDVGIHEPIPDDKTDDLKKEEVDNSSSNKASDEIIKEIKDYGLSNKQIKSIQTDYTNEYLTDKLNQIKYVLRVQPKKIKNKASYMYMSIKDDWIDDLYHCSKDSKEKKSQEDVLKKQKETHEKEELKRVVCLEKQARKVYEGLSELDKITIDREIDEELQKMDIKMPLAYAMKKEAMRVERVLRMIV